MADYEISYTANRPQAPPTGAGAIEWFIQPWARAEGEADWAEVPNTGTTVRLTTAELAAINAMPHSTGAEKQAKNAAVIALLLGNINQRASAVRIGQTPEVVRSIAEANAAAVTEVDAINEYIEVTMGQTFPVRFSV